jgi:hypothetical protein
MNGTDWMDDGVTLAAGLLLALVVGLASSHWVAGVVVLAAWIALCGLSWGLATPARPLPASARSWSVSATQAGPWSDANTPSKLKSSVRAELVEALRRQPSACPSTGSGRTGFISLTKTNWNETP